MKLKDLYSTEYLLTDSAKPKGLWVSVDGELDWVEWCTAEDFGDPTKQYRYRVILKDYANILVIDTMSKLLEFTDEFRSKQKHNFYDESSWYLSWKNVAMQYDGIVISPYQRDARFSNNTTWYHGWDCASGCIWNPRKVISRLYKMRKGDEKWLMPMKIS